MEPLNKNDDLQSKKIECKIDGAMVHSVKMHIDKNYPNEWTLQRYTSEFPGAPILSQYAEKLIADRKREESAREETAEPAQNDESVIKVVRGTGFSKRPLAEAFELGSTPAAKNARGGDVMITMIEESDPDHEALVPDVDANYVWNIPLLKNVIIGIELGFPTYLWGLHGTGKTTILEQIAARTGRAFMRVQHTINMEETDVTGNFIVKDGETKFEYGPLAVAMLNGYVYCADEYDFAMPSVLSVYQPVLEKKPLVIKNAPANMRVVKPHKNFRFVATGNTNGGGDETGLYQGTQMQNAANYSRFGIVEEVEYMNMKIETEIIANQARITEPDAERLVKFAKEIREAFRAGRIASTISPRELITSAKLGIVKGADWREGLRLGFTNRLSRSDKEAVSQVAQRIFG